MCLWLKKKELYIISLLLGLFLIAAFSANFLIAKPDETAELAWSFIHGHTYFLHEFPSPDLIKYNNRLYWVLPPFPAILAIPIVAVFQKPLELNFLNFILNLLLFGLIYKLAFKIFHFNQADSLWLSLMYLFSSIFVSATLTASPYYLAHTIAAILIVLSFLEYYGHKRFWLIGILLGLTFLTRFMAGLAIIFYYLIIIFSQEEFRKKVKDIFLLTAPVFASGCLLLVYNYIRFNNPLESGYRLTDFYNNFSYYHPYGLFSPLYIPTNFFYYFLESFKPYLKELGSGVNNYLLQAPFLTANPMGATSFFLVSPLFIFIYQSKLKIKEVKFALITAGLILLLLLNYFFIGFSPQVGGRYLNDLLPLAFLALLYVFQEKNLGYKHKIIILVSAVLNLYLYFSTIAVYS